MSDKKSDALVELAQTGDESAVAALYELYFDPIYRFFYWQTNSNIEVAQDLTHDTFIEMVKSLHNFRFKSSFKNWLYMIAKHVLAKWLRSKYDIPTTQLFDNLSKPEESIDPEKQGQTIERVRQLLSSLSQTERDVIVLRFLQNYSTKEVATALNISIANVKTITHRTLKKLQNM